MKKNTYKNLGIIGMFAVFSVLAIYYSGFSQSTLIGTKTITASAPGCPSNANIYIYKWEDTLSHGGFTPYMYIIGSCEGNPTPYTFEVKESAYMQYEICNAPKYLSPSGIPLNGYKNDDGTGRECGSSVWTSMSLREVDVTCIKKSPAEWMSGSGNLNFGFGTCVPAPICTEGEKRCYQGNIETCGVGGYDWAITEICEFDCNSLDIICQVPVPVENESGDGITGEVITSPDITNIVLGAVIFSIAGLVVLVVRRKL
jgi:hypothetical protein